MSIYARIEDAYLLWNQNRYEGAFLSTLIAVAASARRQYPALTDRKAFEQFLKDDSLSLSVEYQGECQPIEHILYKWLRCELVHKGGIPIDIEFMPTNAISVRAGGAPDYVLKISHGWFQYLINIVVNAPINADEFANGVVEKP